MGMENKTMVSLGAVSTMIGGVISGFGYYKYNEANMMKKALEDASNLFGATNDTLRSLNRWETYSGNYKIMLVIGVVVLLVGGIVLIAGILTNRNETNSSIKEKECLENDLVKKTYSERLAELETLKKQGLISENEYEEKRKKILESL